MSSPEGKRSILLIGKDARTDAIAAACRDSSSSCDLYAFAEMPTPGLLEKCRRVFTGSLRSTDQLVAIAKEVEPDLAIVGPEEPLAAGFVDTLDSLGIAAFGPTQQLAAIESSKSWARALLDRHNIPGNPEYRVFTDRKGLTQYLEDLGAFVIKPDGLTAGKGVRVFGEHLHSLEDAVRYAEDLLTTDGKVQIEERLEGQEFSLQTITDGESVVHCPPVQDHKRAFERDTGPNTGGMGSYSSSDLSLPFLAPDDVNKARSINEQVINALSAKSNQQYRGVLYGGFIAVDDDVRLIEYNARFGDPEVMNVLPILKADFVDLCAAVTTGTLGAVPYAFETKATVCKYIVPASYPEPSVTRERIIVPDGYPDSDQVKWYWAACVQEDDNVYLTASRAGAVVGLGDSLAEAEQTAEHAAQKIGGAVRHRSDIGRADLIEARIEHMKSLRGGLTLAGRRD